LEDGPWGKAYLNRFYHHVNDKFNDNYRDVKNRFKNKDDLIIHSFFTHPNLRHDPIFLDQLKAYCAMRELELATLVFIDVGVHL
jgi:hypothetical protein